MTLSALRPLFACLLTLALAWGCASTDDTERSPGSAIESPSGLASDSAPEDAPVAQWPQFRGAGGTASDTEASIPDRFGPGQNVLWKQTTPAGHSSPAIWGDRMYLTGYEGATLLVEARSRADGSLVWRREIDPAGGSEAFSHDHCCPAAPSPCTDGERVFAYFGGHGLIAYDADGTKLWEKHFPVEANMFGTGTSPVLDGDSVFLVRDVNGLSDVTSYDTATGEERWSVPRPEANANYATPFVWHRADRTELIVPGSSVLKSYDARTGEVLWWVDDVCNFVCTSPTANEDTLYFGSWATGNVGKGRRLATAFDVTNEIPDEVLEDPEPFIAYFDKNGNGTIELDELPASRAKDAFEFLDFDQDGSWSLAEIQGFLEFEVAPGRNVMVAVRGGGKGNVTATHVRWERTRGLPYVSSPLLYRDRIYLVRDGGLLTSVDASTGKPFIDRARLGVGGEYYASPVGAGDRILVAAERGTLFVIAAGGEELDIVQKTDFGEGIYATPAIVDDTVYLRTEGHLWAFRAGAAN